MGECVCVCEVGTELGSFFSLNLFLIPVLVTADVCPAPKIPNGVLTPAKPAYGKGESVRIRCNPGCSFPDGSAEVTVTCQEQSSWGALQHCACE